jgi:hypothetical protein
MEEQANRSCPSSIRNAKQILGFEQRRIIEQVTRETRFELADRYSDLSIVSMACN